MDAIPAEACNSCRALLFGQQPLAHVARGQPARDQLALERAALLQAFALGDQLGQVGVWDVVQGLGVGVHVSRIWRPA